MAKAQVITTNFTAGEFSPRLRGRSDLEKYNSSMRAASNVVVLKQGGVTARPSLDYLSPIKVEASPARLVPFIYSATTSYVLEFGNLTMRVRKQGVLVESSPGTPFELATPFTSDVLDFLDFTQSGDTMIIATSAGQASLHRLRRFGDAVWALDGTSIPGPIGENGHRGPAATLSAASVGTGRTVTAGSSIFRNADVGRRITSGAGAATITGYTSATAVTVTITEAFASTTLAADGWLIEGTPLTTATPSVTGPEGAAVSVSLLTGGFRPADVGRYIELNGGLIRIDSVAGIGADTDTYSGDGGTTVFAYTFQILAASEITVTVDGVAQVLTTDYTLSGVGNPAGGNVTFLVAPPNTAPNNVVISRAAGASEITATGVVLRELSATTAAPADGWTLKGFLWNDIDGWPTTVTFYQQRLWAGNTRRYPISVWGSKTGLFFDFLPGPNDDDAVYKTIDSKEATPITFLQGSKTLLALTGTAEFDIRGGIEKPVTQSNASISRQSKWGIERVKPEEVGDNLLIVQRAGKVIRATYPAEVEGFGARDISIFSEHLVAAGVRAMSFQQSPESVAWIVTQDGKLVATTYSAEQNVIAMVGCSTIGNVESIATVPEGSTDATYMLVRRGARRLVERINWTVNPGMDSRVVCTGGPTVWGGLSHLAGQVVTVLADGIAAGEFTVAAGGTITLPNEAAVVTAGLPYVPSVTLQDPEISTGTGTAQAQNISTNKVTVRFLNTVGCTVNGQALTWEQFGDDPLDGVIPAFTGDKDISEYGWSKGESPAVISQPQPYPWTVLAVIREVTVNAG